MSHKAGRVSCPHLNLQHGRWVAFKTNIASRKTILKNHDWVLANLFNVMAYAESEGLEAVISVMVQTITQISAALVADADDGEAECRQQLRLVSSSPRQ